MSFDRDQIQVNLATVKERISRAATRVGRLPESVKLVVVTKSHPLEIVKSAIEAGAKSLGENYADEGLEKIKQIGRESTVEWHMIGHVQSRKVDTVVGNFHLIHSVDSYRLAEKINRVAIDLALVQNCLVQVNVSGEESKFGIPCWTDDHYPALLAEIDNIFRLSNIKLKGLMTIPPFGEDPEESRPFFRRLKTIQAKLQGDLPGAWFSDLSMGMSIDYEVAIEEGATIVRVGTAILGERAKKG